MIKFVPFFALTFHLAILGYGFEIEPRIINGDVVYPRDFPFLVKLVKSNKNFCGGTLISDK